jgi:hypothetical protein
MDSSTLSAPAAYLQVPRDYCRHFADLRWSAARDAIEFAGNGSTFALTQQVAQFIEGTAAGRLLHFGFILHLLHLIGIGRREAPARAEPLRLAFRELAQSPGVLRNAGALCAKLCESVPPVAEPFDLDDARRLWVTSASLLPLVGSLCRLNAPEVPPLPPAEFEARVLTALKAYTLGDLKHWLRTGRGPVEEEAGERLAEEVQVAPPRTLATLFDRLAERPRLGGAVPFVAQLAGALALPPRRLDHRQLPMGGYADVTTRGQPDQLLPSQFALDDLEFVRRFAARELLYYRREEPHARPGEEWVLLLDQGVRAWGDVRLVLTAAVFALVRQAHARRTPVLLATTGNGGAPLSLLEVDEPTLAALLEASDLTADPGLALESLLREPSTEPRDIVLLTHPRNLHEPDVAAAARTATAATRLFALTVDEHFQAELAEIRHGAPVALSRFRVGRPGKPVSTRKRTRLARGQWQGDIEPVGYPFFFGITTKAGPFGFDGSGDWLIVSSQNGTLHAFHADGVTAEVLPRAMHDGGVFQEVQAVLGVAGGFAVAGLVGSARVVAHYQWASRNCTVHWVGDGRSSCRWWYLPQYHCVAATSDEGARAVDLSTGEVANDSYDLASKSRVMQAYLEAADYRVAPPGLYILPNREAAPSPGDLSRAIHLDQTTGELRIWAPDHSLASFTPLVDGRPRFRSCQVVAAQYCVGVLAVRMWDGAKGYSIHCFRITDGGSFTAYEPLGGPGFALSANGRRLAVQTAQSQLAVHDLETSARLLETPVGGCHGDLQVQLGHGWMTLTVGQRGILLHWLGPALAVQLSRRLGPDWPQRAVQAAGLNAARLVVARGKGAFAGNYDPKRFVGAARWGELCVDVDAFGHVAVCDPNGALLCMFFVFRNHLHASLLDGTVYQEWTGADPRALAKIGRVLREASLSTETVRP